MKSSVRKNKSYRHFNVQMNSFVHKQASYGEFKVKTQTLRLGQNINYILKNGSITALPWIYAFIQGRGVLFQGTETLIQGTKTRASILMFVFCHETSNSVPASFLPIFIDRVRKNLILTTFTPSLTTPVKSDCDVFLNSFPISF